VNGPVIKFGQPLEWFNNRKVTLTIDDSRLTILFYH
jgi:hypothetical protein